MENDKVGIPPNSEPAKSAIDLGNDPGLERHNVAWVLLGVTPTKSKVGEMWALAGC